MPNLEWKVLGEEPGCRQAAMDPQIRLFGRILSATPSRTGSGADAGVLTPESVSPPSSQDGGDSIHRGAENKMVSERLVSARSSSADESLQLFKNTESCGAAPGGAQQQQQSQPLLCDDSEGGQSDEQQDSPSMGNSDGKKPDKVVPCPRCLSQDTKFCYFNNYNVNQPRHFCKNCQRYWTAGGTLRNVPVGAGRRKNKTGNLQQQRENEASQNSELSCGLASPKAKLSHPKRLPGPSSPLRSPGSSSPLGPESGVTMCSPPYSLYQGGRLPFQSFNSCSQGFTSAGTELSAVGSSETASSLRGQRRVCHPAGIGVDKDCSRSPRSEQVQDASMLQQQRREVTSDTVSEWAAANTGGHSVRFFNGEWSHGYNLDWDGKHPHPVPQAFAPVLTNYNTSSAGPTPATSTCTPAWAWMGSPQWTGAPHQPLPAILGKRQGGRVEGVPPAKTLRTDVEPSSNSRSRWPMLQGRTPPTEVCSNSALKHLFQNPKPEPSCVRPPKDTFMSRLFMNASAALPVPSPVTI